MIIRKCSWCREDYTSNELAQTDKNTNDKIEDQEEKEFCSSQCKDSSKILSEALNRQKETLK